MSVITRVLFYSGLVLLMLTALWKYALAPQWTQRLPPGWTWQADYIGTSANPDPVTGGDLVK
jgi:hypothetical protein